MKFSLGAFAITLLASISIFSADVSKNDKINAAVVSVQSWLEIIDSGSYSESWSLAGKMFQEKSSDSQWTDALNKVRKPLGGRISRDLKSSKYKTSLPGVPDGEYVVTQFKTSFEKKKKAIETATAVYENDKWQVVGYFIK
jgi:hypothetical protein